LLVGWLLLVLPVLLWIVVSLAWLVRLLLLRLLWLLTRMQRSHHGGLARSEPSLDRGTWRPWLVRHRCVVLLCVHARRRRPDSDRVAAHHWRWSESVLLAVSLIRHHRSVTSSLWRRVILMLWVHAGNRLWLLWLFGRRL
jgi:hypothetical protein